MVTQLVGLAVRVAALFLFFSGLSNAMGMLPMVERYYDQGDVPLSFISLLAAPLVVSLLLWRFPLAVARRLLPPTEDSTPISAVPFEEIHVAVLSTVGLLLLAFTLRDVATWVAWTFDSPGNTRVGLSYPATTVFVLTRLGLSLWLMLGARGLVGLLRMIREMGMR